MARPGQRPSGGPPGPPLRRADAPPARSGRRRSLAAAGSLAGVGGGRASLAGTRRPGGVQRPPLPAARRRCRRATGGTTPSPSSKPGPPPTRPISRPGSSCPACYLQQAIRTSDPAFYDLTPQVARHRRRGWRPDDHATTVTEGVLALSPPRLRAGARPGQSRARAGGRRPRPALHPDRRQRRARPLRRGRGPRRPSCSQRRPGSAALSRLSYLRELHGDLERRPAGDAPGRAGRRLAERPGHHRHLRRRPAPGRAGPHRRRGRLRPRRAGQPRPPHHRDRPGPRWRRPTAGWTTAITTLSARRRAHADAGAGDAPGRAPAGGRAGRTRPRPASPWRRPGPSSWCRAGSTVDLESAVFLADHGDPAEAVDAGPAGLRRPPHGLHRRRARVGADPRRPARRRRCPTSQEALRLGTRAPGLHAHAALAYRRRRVRTTRPRAALGTAFALLGLAGAGPAPRGRRRWPTGSASPSPPTGGRDAPVHRASRWPASSASPWSPPPCPARPAAAHPLGNLTVNTYAGIVVAAGRGARSTTCSTWPSSPPSRPCSASTPTATAPLSPAEGDAYRIERVRRPWPRGLAVELASTPVTLARPGPPAPALAARPGRPAHAPPRVHADRPGRVGDEHRAVASRTGNLTDRIGWREITLNGDGTTVSGADVPTDQLLRPAPAPTPPTADRRCGSSRHGRRWRRADRRSRRPADRPTGARPRQPPSRPGEPTRSPRGSSGRSAIATSPLGLAALALAGGRRARRRCTPWRPVTARP